MKNFIKIVLIVLFCAACSDLEENIVSPDQAISVHKDGIKEKSSSNFHGNLVKNSADKLYNCQGCHASDYSGAKTDVNCVTCHSSLPVHAGNSSMISHRDYIKENGGDMSQCQQCHSDDFSGGIVSPDCSTCHSSIAVHAKGKNMIYHKQYLQETNWKLDNCQQCHGENYSGGLTSPTCLTCHSKTDGPENCSTCHFDGTIEKGNDFHQMHLETTSFSKVACSDCHLIPSQVNSEGHLDGNAGVELTFSGIATTITNEPGTEGRITDLPALNPNPIFNKSEGSCSNVYCHGYFKNGNNENVVKYGDGFVCGSCHGDKDTGNPLPKGSHTTISACYLCHSTVDAGKNFVKPSQHINGILNVYDQERNF